MEQTQTETKTEQVTLKPEQMLEITAGDLGKIYNAYLTMAHLLNEVGPHFNTAKLVAKQEVTTTEA